MFNSHENVRAAFEAYTLEVQRGDHSQRIAILKRLIGENATLPPETLWRVKNDTEQDYLSVLQRERMSAEQAFRSYGWNGRNDVGPFVRLLFIEELPESLRPFMAIDPRAYFSSLQSSVYMKARTAFELMLPHHFNVSEMNVPGIGVTRRGLGGLIERAQMSYMTVF